MSPALAAIILWIASTIVQILLFRWAIHSRKKMEADILELQTQAKNVNLWFQGLFEDIKTE